jgi:hypothetical protein
MGRKLLILLFIIAGGHLKAQNDTIITYDHTVLYGDFKGMDKGVLTFKTSYSDSDFKIEWLKVKMLISDKKFRVVHTSGERYFGSLKKDTIHNKIIVSDKEKGFITLEIVDIVYLKDVDEGSLFDIMNLALDLGYSYTKSNNLHQFNGSVHADYYRKTWGIALKANTIKNAQDNAPSTDRFTGNLDFRVFLSKVFFSSVIADYYSNNEQQLHLRSNYNVSIGQYIIRTNKVYFNYSIGFAYNYEDYITGIDNVSSLEGSLKVEFNLFDMGDLNMFTNVTCYPGITEKGRLRLISKFTAKYDLPRDFYLKASYDYNLDNKAVEGATDSDYVFTFGLGWEL